VAKLLFFCRLNYDIVFDTKILGGINMNSKTLVFSNPDDVVNFVRTVEQYPYNMDVRRGKCIVDAKSLLGILNLGCNREIELKVYEDECSDLFQNIEQYVVA